MSSGTNRLGTRVVGVVIVLLTAAWTSVAHAGGFGDYKDDKHDSSGSSDDFDDDDDGDDSDDDDDDSGWGEVLGALVASGANSRSNTEVGPGQTGRRGSAPCHYDHYYGCLRECSDAKKECRARCRRQANSLCGTPSAAAAGPVSGTGVGGTSTDATGVVELGAGAVEEGALGMLEARVKFEYLGVGAQTSMMWDRTDWLLESDVGPVIFAPLGSFEFGLQPSILISTGNGVETRVGTGVRIYSGYKGEYVLFDVEPMGGYINERFNMHLRSGVGVFVPQTDAFLKLGYDFRYVKDAGGSRSSVLHGGFLSVGLRGR